MLKENINDTIIRNIVKNNKDLFRIIGDVDYPNHKQIELTRELFLQLKHEIQSANQNKQFDWEKDKLILPVTTQALNWEKQIKNK